MRKNEEKKKKRKSHAGIVILSPTMFFIKRDGRSAIHSQKIYRSTDSLSEATLFSLNRLNRYLPVSSALGLKVWLEKKQMTFQATHFNLSLQQSSSSSIIPRSIIVCIMSRSMNLVELRRPSLIATLATIRLLDKASHCLRPCLQDQNIWRKY